MRALEERVMSQAVLMQEWLCKNFITEEEDQHHNDKEIFQSGSEYGESDLERDCQSEDDVEVEPLRLSPNLTKDDYPGAEDDNAEDEGFGSPGPESQHQQFTFTRRE